jgi:hypothetical protein
MPDVFSVQRPALSSAKVPSRNVIAVRENALECHVQGVGAVESEDEALRFAAVKELVEQMASFVERMLGGESHLVSSAAGIGETLAREAVEGLIDGFGLGKTRRGVVEVDHRRLQTRRAV